MYDGNKVSSSTARLPTLLAAAAEGEAAPAQSLSKNFEGLRVNVVTSDRRHCTESLAVQMHMWCMP